jgi:hypothetical protein
MVTTSAAAGCLAGLHVDGEDQGPSVTLRIVGLAAKFGTWSCGV